MGVFERRWGNRHSTFNSLQSVYYDGISNLQARLHYPHITELRAEVDRLDRGGLSGATTPTIRRKLRGAHKLPESFTATAVIASMPSPQFVVRFRFTFFHLHAATH